MHTWKVSPLCLSFDSVRLFSIWRHAGLWLHTNPDMPSKMFMTAEHTLAIRACSWFFRANRCIIARVGSEGYIHDSSSSTSRTPSTDSSSHEVQGKMIGPAMENHVKTGTSAIYWALRPVIVVLGRFQRRKTALDHHYDMLLERKKKFFLKWIGPWRHILDLLWPAFCFLESCGRGISVLVGNETGRKHKLGHWQNRCSAT